MPGRKSNISTTSNGPEEVSEIATSKSSKEKDGISVEDLSLPKSMIARLAKGVLPANTQIHKDALLALHKSATVFVSYIASNSNENAQGSGKKTISPQDVIAALKDAELGDFLPRLEAELKKYNDTQCDKRNTYRRKVKEEKAAAAAKGDVSEVTANGSAAEDANGSANGHVENGDDGVERPMKKVKRENGTTAVPDVDDADDDGDDDDNADQEDESDEANEESENEAADDDEVDAEDDEEEDEDGNDETMEDPLDEDEERSAIHDEALDESDSD